MDLSLVVDLCVVVSMDMFFDMARFATVFLTTFLQLDCGAGVSV